LHEYAVGQHVSYAEDGIAWPWKGGYEILALEPIGTQGPQYRIRNVDQSYDRVVDEPIAGCCLAGKLASGTRIYGARSPFNVIAGFISRRHWRLRETRAPAYRWRSPSMNAYIAILAFTASVMGLFFIFDVLPGIGSFAGSVLLVVGGTVLVSKSMLWEAMALAARARRPTKRLEPSLVSRSR
jgi:hypothetical protein